jgi:hypothetical protein
MSTFTPPAGTRFYAGVSGAGIARVGGMQLATAAAAVPGGAALARNRRL